MKSFVGSVLLTLVLATLVGAAQPPTAAPVPTAKVEQLVDGDPQLKKWKPAAFPQSLPDTVRSGKATLRIIVDETGAITASRILRASEPAFGEAALEAAKGWSFSPGVDNGKYAAMCLDVPFDFSRDRPPQETLMPDMGHLPRLASRRKAELVEGPVGDYPASLVGRGLAGAVTFGCIVGPDGSASDLRILRASHADFILPALASSANWKFKCAEQGDLKVRAELIGEVFYLDTKTPPRNQVLAVNGVTAPDGSEPDAAPQLIEMADPVFPYDALIKGDGGSATVEFTVAFNGSVRDVKVREASQPAFGAALKAAVEAWRFNGAMKNGRGVDVTLLKKAQFAAVPLNLPAEADADPTARLVRLTRTDAIGGGRGLDQKLAPLYRVAPLEPDGVTKEGPIEVVMEFVIDRDGRARLPHIVSATKEEFGWAAATAVSQWVFTAPTRAGQPTEVKVKIPLKF